MTFLIRCLVLALAAFGVATVVASVCVALTWWHRSHRLSDTDRRTAADRADALLHLRLVPGLTAVLTALFAVVGLWRFESRETDEVLGWTLIVSATCGAAYLGVFLTRLALMYRETIALMRTWLDGAARLTLPGITIPAFRITTGFPVVAVVGVFRPTLVVDTTVLEACSPDELSAILAHEQGHLRRWDNLRRALFAATPDLLGATPMGPHLLAAWREATEEAADDVAAERGEDARVHLATALLRVARLAPTTTRHDAATFHGAQLPASALYRGESVERRVRRLCAAPVITSHTRRGWGIAAAALVLTVALGVQQDIHDVMEVIVAALP
jgi:beta-lactamase regulating signal transducer with metallopeptidase domain